MPRAFAVLLPLALLLVVGCGGGGTSKPKPTSTTEETTTAAATTIQGTGTPTPDIRRQDWAQQSTIKNYIAGAGGEVDTAAIIYADLTSDGVADAVVPIGSGGEGGDIALFIFGYVDGSLQNLLTLQAHVQAKVEQGVLTTTEPVYAAGDPGCCPSQLRTTTYRWTGSMLTPDQQNTGPAPTP